MLFSDDYWRISFGMKKFIRSIPDYPKPGIIFRDITTLLERPSGLESVVNELAEPFQAADISYVAGIEARGFILGGAVAHKLSTGFLAVRKKGKLPAETISVEYELEYGIDEVEIHVDSVKHGDNILIVDDLIATGGTACAAATLVQNAGGQVVGASFVIELPEIGGRKKLENLGIEVRSLVVFEGE